MKYKITTMRVEEDTMVVFYEFENGDINTNRFPFPSDFSLIQKWGEDRASWFDKRDLELKEMERQVEILEEALPAIIIE